MGACKFYAFAKQLMGVAPFTYTWIMFVYKLVRWKWLSQQNYIGNWESAKKNMPSHSRFIIKIGFIHFKIADITSGFKNCAFKEIAPLISYP